jgi:hypothetical protein
MTVLKDKEEGNLWEQPLIHSIKHHSCCPNEVDLTGQMNRLTHNCTPDKACDEGNKLSPSPLASKWVPNWRQLTDGLNKNVISLTTPAKDRMWHPISTRTEPHTVFSCYILHLLSFYWWRKQILPWVLGHTWQWTSFTTWHYWIWNASVFWWLFFKWDMASMTAWWTVGQWLNSSSHLFMAQQWNMTGSWFFCIIHFKQFWNGASPAD